MWQGRTVTGGYGRMGIGSRTDGTRRQVLVHRAAYEAKHGPIPNGLTLDHFVCDRPGCVNPDHVRGEVRLRRVFSHIVAGQRP